MATRVAAVGEVTGFEEMERRLVWLVEQVEREKEKTRDTFQQLHNLLVVREQGVLMELDGVVVEARQEIKDKKKALEALRAAKESTESDLAMNKLKQVLKRNLKNIEDEIREEVKPLSVTWVEVKWKREELEQLIVELFKVVKMKKGPFRPEHYSLKLRPVWYHEGTGSSVIEDPQQLAIDTKSGNIFIADYAAKKIKVFDKTGHYLYYIPTPPYPVGLCLSDQLIFVTTEEKKLAKIQISNKKTTKSVVTEKLIYGMDFSYNIYVCECSNNSVSVFDTNLNFLKRIHLKSPYIAPNTTTYSIRLYENNMYVMFPFSDRYCLQVFSQDGQLIRGVIPRSDIKRSFFFFSIDQIGNIIVADCHGHQIKIFSNSGHLIHSISNDMLTEAQKLSYPRGISVDKQNNIVVAHCNKKCSLIAF